MDNDILFILLRQLVHSMTDLIHFTYCPNKRALILLLLIPCLTHFHHLLFTSLEDTVITWYTRSLHFQDYILGGNDAMVKKDIASKLLVNINIFISIHEATVLKDIMAEVDNSDDLTFDMLCFNS